jgi:hypothetical protein
MKLQESLTRPGSKKFPKHVQYIFYFQEHRCVFKSTNRREATGSRTPGLFDATSP